MITMIAEKNQSIDIDQFSPKPVYAVCIDTDGRETRHRLFVMAIDGDGRSSFQTVSRKMAHELPGFVRLEFDPVNSTRPSMGVSAEAAQSFADGWRGSKRCEVLLPKLSDLNEEGAYGRNA